MPGFLPDLCRSVLDAVSDRDRGADADRRLEKGPSELARGKIPLPDPGDVRETLGGFLDQID